MLLSLRRAARLIAVSAATARDLSRLPGVDPARIRVIPEAPAPGIAPASPDTARELARRLRLPQRFFLFLGALEPRKNVVALVRALALLREQGDAETHLVIAGAEGWDNAQVHREVRRRGLEEQVRFLGYVAAADLPALYGATLAFVYPSLYEGFGLPPLEAMASGAPVICSNTSSLPEVTGDAAVLVDPESVGDLAAALRRVRDDESLRLRLKGAGLERSRLFSWGRAARATLEVYHEAVTERGRVGGNSHARRD
jgi:glycosyltransferase involved in cell wall biosynthesis